MKVKYCRNFSFLCRCLFDKDSHGFLGSNTFSWNLYENYRVTGFFIQAMQENPGYIWEVFQWKIYRNAKILLGPNAPIIVSDDQSFKAGLEQDYRDWSRRDLSNKRYVYVWADAVYSTVRMDDRLCLLVIIGSDETEHKELLALSDGYRESEASWTKVLRI